MRKGTIVGALLAALVTLLALAPVGYALFRRLPLPIATVDLQKLVEEEQNRTLGPAASANGGVLADDVRAHAEQRTVAFAKRLSLTMEALGETCRCVIVNKAALLSGSATDYTDQVRERLKP